MTTPTYSELQANSTGTQDGLNPETVEERILTTLAIIASGENPDGSPSPGFNGAYVPTATKTTLPASVAPNEYWVSKGASASDSNSGDRYAPFATIAQAVTTLGANPGKIKLGYGTWAESFTYTAGGQMLEGDGPVATVIEVNTNIAAVTLGHINCTLRDLTVQLGGSATTGTALVLNGAFLGTIDNVALLGNSNGTTYTGQTGILIEGNSGDNKISNFVIGNFGVGVQVGNSINWFQAGTFSSNVIGVQGGDPTGVAVAAGAVFKSVDFTGPGTTYVNLNGSSAAWDFDSVWLDGGANNGFIIGVAGVGGPQLCRISAQQISATTNNIIINQGFCDLDGIDFHAPAGHTPTDLTINATYAASGSARGLIPSGGSDVPSGTFPTNWNVDANLYSHRGTLTIEGNGIVDGSLTVQTGIISNGGTTLAGGLVIGPIVTVNSTGNVATTTMLELANATSGSITRTLYTAGTSGHQVTIKKTDSSANTVTVAAPAGYTIDGAASVALTAQNEAVTVTVYGGTEWYVTGQVASTIL